MTKHSFVVTVKFDKNQIGINSREAAYIIRNTLSELEDVKKVTVTPVGEK